RPEFLHGAYIERGELTDIAVIAGHFIKPPCGSAGASAAFFQFEFLSVQFETALAERDDQAVGRLVIADRVPIMTARRTGTALNPLSRFLFENILPVSWGASDRIKFRPHVLKDRFFMAQIFSGFAVELPQHCILADGENEALTGV